MNSTDHDSTRPALFLVGALVSLVVIGVVSLGVSKAFSAHRTTSAQAPDVAPFKLYFETGSATLPLNAQAVLGQVTELARANEHAKVVVSGFHDATGDSLANVELAKNRALAVHHALEANGVAARAIELDQPQVTTGGLDPQEARRVDITVR